MSLMSKNQIENDYDSYEAIAQAFTGCIEIYIVTHSSSDKPSHYSINYSRADTEAMFSSPFISEPNLVWSKSRGAIIPFKSVK
jgi:hypothetical protein